MCLDDPLLDFGAPHHAHSVCFYFVSLNTHLKFLQVVFFLPPFSQCLTALHETIALSNASQLEMLGESSVGEIDGCGRKMTRMSCWHQFFCMFMKNLPKTSNKLDFFIRKNVNMKCKHEHEIFYCAASRIKCNLSSCTVFYFRFKWIF